MIQPTRLLASITFVLMFSAPLRADPVTLTFEGVTGPIGSFYAGGGGGNFGIQFTPAAIGLVDSDAGGSGFFANEPSPSTVLAFGGTQPQGLPAMNVEAGFRSSLRFSYSQPFMEMPDTVFSRFDVAVFSDVNGQGSELGRWTLASTNPFAPGDPTGGLFGAFTSFTGTFAGTAHSVVWIEPRNLTGAVFDNLSIDTSATPEPASLWLLGAGAAALARSRRRGILKKGTTAFSSVS
jgi:hypothetical protein